MYTQIVVGTDGSPTAGDAVSHAIELAATFGARLHIVSAVRTPAAALAAPEPALVGAAAEADAAARETAREALDAAHEEAQYRSIDVESHLATGDPAEALCKVAAHVGADLIVVGNKGMQGARRLLGSVPNAVSHHAPCTVLIVRTV